MAVLGSALYGHDADLFRAVRLTTIKGCRRGGLHPPPPSPLFPPPLFLPCSPFPSPPCLPSALHLPVLRTLQRETIKVPPLWAER